MSPLPVVILLSGTGTNFSAIAARVRAGDLPIEIRAVISDRPEAEGLRRARALGITTLSLPPRDFADRERHDKALMNAIDAYHPALVVLAGYMRIFTAALVRHYADRMLNIHPSLLPQFRGLNTHQRALDAGVTEHGCSVHFVTEELDGGPVVAQAPVPVRPEDSAATLALRVHAAEHRLYPTVLDWVARGRLRCDAGNIHFDGQPLPVPLRLEQLYEPDR